MNQPRLFADIETDAVFSPDRVYRYVLTRTWDSFRPRVNFVMLNPSTADEVVNDPTVTRCQNFARDWGYGGLVVTNIFALRATDPKDMLAHPDPVGPENDNIIVSQAMHAKVVVCAWGEDGKHLGWAASVVALLRRYSIPLYCLQRNQSGEPSHPLYLRKDLKPIPWT